MHFSPFILSTVTNSLFFFSRTFCLSFSFFKRKELSVEVCTFRDRIEREGYITLIHE